MQTRKKNMRRQKSMDFLAIFKNKLCKLEKTWGDRNLWIFLQYFKIIYVLRQKSVEFASIFQNKICKLEKKAVNRQKLVGFPAIFKKS